MHAVQLVQFLDVCAHRSPVYDGPYSGLNYNIPGICRAIIGVRHTTLHTAAQNTIGLHHTVLPQQLKMPSSEFIPRSSAQYKKITDHQTSRPGGQSSVMLHSKVGSHRLPSTLHWPSNLTPTVIRDAPQQGGLASTPIKVRRLPSLAPKCHSLETENVVDSLTQSNVTKHVMKCRTLLHGS